MLSEVPFLSFSFPCPMRRFLAALLLTVPAQVLGAVCSYVDDYPNDPSVAHSLPGSTTLTGKIEVESDRDVFLFMAMPFYTYTIQVAPGGSSPLQDVELRVYDADKITLAKRNSSTSASNQAAYTYPGSGFAHPVYVDVRAFAEFSTGTYQLVLQVTPPQDSDGDGLPDAWETFYGLLSNNPSGDHGADGDPDGDGISNWMEYIAGTHPFDASSALKITRVESLPGSRMEVTWPAHKFGRYRLLRSTGLQPGAWEEVYETIHQGETGFAQFTDTQAGQGTNRFYRVEFRY